MKKKFTLLMASMMLLGASAAQAWTDSGCCYEDPCCEDQTGFYVGTFAGANFISTSKSCSDVKRDFDTGYVVDASIGYRWCHNLRVEFEYAYRNNQIRHKWYDSHSSECGSGRHSKHKHYVQNAYMFNGVWDLDFCNDWCFKPFLGVGIGYAQNRNGHHNRKHHSHDVKALESVVAKDGCEESCHHKKKKDQNGFAWQIIAGIAYPICDEIDLSLEYRFFKGSWNKINNNDVGVGLKYYF